jgi:hypothetical protein
MLAGPIFFFLGSACRLVVQPALQSVMIDPDLKSYRLLSIVRFLELSLQRTQQHGLRLVDSVPKGKGESTASGL